MDSDHSLSARRSVLHGAEHMGNAGWWIGVAVGGDRRGSGFQMIRRSSLIQQKYKYFTESMLFVYWQGMSYKTVFTSCNLGRELIIDFSNWLLCVHGCIFFRRSRVFVPRRPSWRTPSSAQWEPIPSCASESLGGGSGAMEKMGNMKVTWTNWRCASLRGGGA